MSFQELVALNSEGMESVFPIQCDIVIGRGKEADIRVDLKSISRKHAHLHVDENQECKLINLSATNPSIVNMIPVESEVVLKNGDIIVIGERTFKFRSKGLSSQNDVNIDNESNTNPISARANDAKSKPSFLLELGQQLASRGLKTIAESELVKPTFVSKKSISTPLKEAIKSRRKSFGKPRPLTEIVHSKAPINKLNLIKNATDQCGTEKLDFNAALKAAVHSRLQSNQTPSKSLSQDIRGTNDLGNTLSEVTADAETTPKGDRTIVQPSATVKHTGPIRKVLSTPIRKAILDRANDGKNIAAAANDKMAIKSDFGRPLKVVSDAMRRAIHARRISNQPTPENDEAANHSTSAFSRQNPNRQSYSRPIKPTLHSSLKSAIESRRRSLKDSTPIKYKEILKVTGGLAIAPFVERISDMTELDAITAANTISNRQVLLPPENEQPAEGGTPPPVNHTDAVLPVNKAAAHHISRCPNTPTTTMEKKSPASNIAVRRLSKIRTEREDSQAPPLLKTAEKSRAVQLATGDRSNDLSAVDHIPQYSIESRNADEFPVEREIYAVEVHPEFEEHATVAFKDEESLPNGKSSTLLRETRLKKIKVSQSASDIRSKRSKSPVYKFGNRLPAPLPKGFRKPKGKKGYCEIIIAGLRKEKRLFGGMSLKQPLKRLRVVTTKPTELKSSEGSKRSEDDDLEMNEIYSRDEDIQNVLVSNPSLAVDAVQALAIELCAHSFANELSQQGVNNSDAFETAMEAVTSDASVFSRRNSLREDKLPQSETMECSDSISPQANSRGRSRESLLNSLQKKAAVTSVAPQDINSEEYDIVSLLTDAELQLVNIYAEKLSMYGLSDDEAHQVSLDAYISGIETYFATLESSVQHPTKLASDLNEGMNQANSPFGESCSETLMNAEENCDEKSLSSNDDYNLRKLFHLPVVYMDANDDTLDSELVEQYAEELQQVANVSAAIAYGIALDTFLADPVEFRHRIGKLPLPRIIPVRTIAEEVEKEYEDWEEQQEYEVPLKISAVQNKHIYFTYEDDDEDTNDQMSVEDTSVASSAAVESVIPSDNVPSSSYEGVSESTIESEILVAGGTVLPPSSELMTEADLPREDNQTLLISIEGAFAAPENSKALSPIAALSAEPATVTQVGQQTVTVKEKLRKGAAGRPKKVVTIATSASNSEAKQSNHSTEVVSAKISEPVIDLCSPDTAKDIVAVPTQVAASAKPRSNSRKRGAVPSVDCADDAPSSMRVTRKRVAEGLIPSAAEVPTVEKDAPREATSPLAGVVRRAGRKAQSADVSSVSAVTVPTVDNSKEAPNKQRSMSRRRRPEASSSDELAAADTRVPVTRKRVAEATIAVSQPQLNNAKKSKREILKKDSYEEALVIICDKCDKEYFVDEIGLSEIPEGDWFCSPCSTSSRSKSVTTKAMRSKKA